MKKRYMMLLLTALTGPIFGAAKTPIDDLRMMIVGYHNQAFGVDNMFTLPKLNPESFVNWRKAVAAVKTYVLEHCADYFNRQDPALIGALEMIEKYNTAMIATILITYANRTSTEKLVIASQQFKNIALYMTHTIDYLEKKSFYLEDKKNSQYILLFLARYIEATAEKLMKDLRNPQILLLATKQQPTVSMTLPEEEEEEEEEEENIPEAPTYKPTIPVLNPPRI